MKTIIKILSIILFVCLSFNIKAQNKSTPKIQVALILDTSNSMDGLIDQAKTELWSVVNELATAKRAGKQPTLEISLYEYGNDNLSKEKGYIRKVVELTSDLDKISEELFALRTNGGYEFCGQVINQAADELVWSKSNKDLKMIFIAGNEEFTQGVVDYTVSCKKAITKGIIVNTIFCGNKEEGINTKWKDGADIADGKYLNIDQNQVVAYIESPFDDDISRLSSELNKTYVAYGEVGEEMSVRQEAQDANAGSQSKFAKVNRAVSKSSGVYVNESWDLVDAVDKGKDISSVEKEYLPEEMQDMNEKEQTEYLTKKKEERLQIQTQINDLNKKRLQYIENIKKENSESNTLGDAMINVVHEQAKNLGFEFSKN